MNNNLLVLFKTLISPLVSKGGAVVRVRASYQFVSGSNPSVDPTCGLSLLLVLFLALSAGFSLGTPGFPSSQNPIFPNSNLTRN